VSVFWNHNPNPLTGDLVFTQGSPANAVVVKTGATVPLDKNADGLPTLKLALQPNEVEAYLTARPQLESAPRAWFDLQREWWKGATTPPPTKLPDLADLDKATVQLGDDWAFKALAASDTPSAFAAPGVDDSKWPRRSLTAQLQTVPTAIATGNVVVYRKKVTIPAGWTNGPVKFFLTPNEAQCSIDDSSLYVDGTLIKDHFDSLVDTTCGDVFKAGSTHTLAIVITSKSCLVGIIGNCWLYYRPDPTQDLDLAGDWDASEDGLDFSQKQTIPGPWNTNMIRGVINIPATASKQTVLLHFEKIAGRISGAIINGTYVGQSHVPVCPSFDLNLTPWIKFGADNKLEIVAGSKMQGTVGKIALDFYDPGTYP
jgi:hypothetical protein